jgi:hypothetical protein
MYYHLKELITKSAEALTYAIATIPDGVTVLDLRNNYFANRSRAVLSQAFGSIPASVTALDLSYNALCLKNGLELGQSLSVIPVNVTELILSGNNLGQQFTEDLKQSIAGIPESVTKLNLAWNALYKKTAIDLVEVFSAIPKHVRELTLSIEDIEKRTPEELIALGRALSHISTINVIDNLGFHQTHSCIELLKDYMGSSNIQNTFNQLGLVPTAVKLPKAEFKKEELIENPIVHMATSAFTRDSFFKTPDTQGSPQVDELDKGQTSLPELD